MYDIYIRRLTTCSINRCPRCSERVVGGGTIDVVTKGCGSVHLPVALCLVGGGEIYEDLQALLVLVLVLVYH